MASDETKYPWTDAQWSEINQIVQQESTKTCVAGGFLPCYGPLSKSTEIVRREHVVENGVDGDKDGRPFVSVDDIETITLWTLSVHVQLKQQQLAEENLAGAHLAFRRAANLIARTEDAIVFRGLPNANPSRDELSAIKAPPQCRVTSGQKSRGLVAAGGLHPKIDKPDGRDRDDLEGGYYGQALVQAMAKAVSDLESHGHLGPFACVLGNNAFVQAQTPEKNSMVLPSDRMKPILNGPVLRCGTMLANDGVVVSLAGNPIDLVVATEPNVQFLHLTDDAKAVFRVYERFALRIKEKRSAWSFFLTPETADHFQRNGLKPKEADCGRTGDDEKDQ